jgi:hypothetical protein
MKMTIAVSSLFVCFVFLVIMLPSLFPFSSNQAQGQISFSCPDGYRQNSLGLCEPMVIMNPSSLECPQGYIKNSSGDCELVGASSQMLNNTTNQTGNPTSSLTQEQQQPLHLQEEQLPQEKGQEQDIPPRGILPLGMRPILLDTLGRMTPLVLSTLDMHEKLTLIVQTYNYCENPTSGILGGLGQDNEKCKQFLSLLDQALTNMLSGE